MWSRTMTSVGEPSRPRCLSWRRRHSVRSRAATPEGSSPCTTQSAFSTSSTLKGPMLAISSTEARSIPSSSRFWMMASPISRVSSSESDMWSCQSRWS